MFLRRLSATWGKLESKCRVQVAIEEIGWLHDVHVGIDEAQTLFHVTPPLAIGPLIGSGVAGQA